MQTLKALSKMVFRDLKSRNNASALFIMLTAMLLPTTASAEFVWLDDSKSDAAPAGKLLTDNESFFGDRVYTGVVYNYENAPDKQADGLESGGRKLLDGIVEGNGSGAVIRSAGSPIVVVFDFKRGCTFSEVDLAVSKGKVGIKLECGSWGAGWDTISTQNLADSRDSRLHRMILHALPKGDRLRMTVSSAGDTIIDEIWAWGDAEVTPQNPEAIKPIFTPLPGGAYRAYSIPGIEKTAFKDGIFKKWVESIGDNAKLPAVWSKAWTWDTLSGSPILPKPEEIAADVAIVMARNETECAALALTNTSMEEVRTAEVVLGEFRRVGAEGSSVKGVKGELSVVGAIPSAVYGVCLSPLFSEDNMPGASLMKRYITNADMIKDFPKLNLPPSTSAIVWVSVTSDGAEPGVYEAAISSKGGAGVKISVEVVDVTLPKAPAWVNTYSHSTRMMPFQPSDRGEREASYKFPLGISVMDGFPSPGSFGDRARKRGKVDFHQYGVPGKYMRSNITLTAEDEKVIADNIKGLVKRAKESGLSYDEWYVEFFDEPNGEGLKTIEKLARIVKRVDPKVRIYCNPVAPDVGEWYNKLIDISCPYAREGLYDESTKSFFSAPRSVNAFYKLLANCSKNESNGILGRFRGLAWEAMSRGWNGWAFYSYYAPGGDPWNDFDNSALPGGDPDWVVVYPGPKGTIPSRASEALREGYEDYCLISLLREKGLNSEADSILSKFVPVDSPGEKRGTGESLEAMRMKALLAAAGKESSK